MSSLSSLRTLARRQYRFDPNGRVFGNDELDVYIQRAYENVQADMGLLIRTTQSLTTVGGTQEYSLDDLLYSIDEDGVKIDTYSLSPCDYSDSAGLTTQSKPTRYYLRQDSTTRKIGFINIPDTAYIVKVFHQQYRPKLSSSQDATTPEKYDLLIALYTAYIAEFTLRGNTPNAEKKLQAYDQEKKRMAGNRHTRTFTFSQRR